MNEGTMPEHSRNRELCNEEVSQPAHQDMRILDSILQAFEVLPKKGKPQPNEHTVLAGYVVTREGISCGPLDSNQTLTAVVALGTGTKCLGGSHRSCAGDLLNDSHAEVIARRALLRWLYTELSACARLDCPDPHALFHQTQDKRMQKHGDWQLHLFVSQLPCGDACVSQEGLGLGDGDALRTGAKLVRGGPLGRNSASAPPSAADVESVGAAQALRVLRRKPGRGDATLSMSCSDKLARCSCLGVQGALLSTVLHEPLYLSSLLVALPPATFPPPDDRSLLVAQQSTLRAISGRLQDIKARLQPPFTLRPPAVRAVWLPMRAMDVLGLGVTAQRVVPSGVAVNWSAGPSREWRLGKAGPSHGPSAMHEVTLAASGRKAGVAKKGKGWSSPATRSSLCKACMLDCYLHLVRCLGSRSLPARLPAPLSQPTGTSPASSAPLPRTPHAITARDVPWESDKGDEAQRQGCGPAGEVSSGTGGCCTVSNFPVVEPPIVEGWQAVPASDPARETGSTAVQTPNPIKCGARDGEQLGCINSVGDTSAAAAEGWELLGQKQYGALKRATAYAQAWEALMEAPSLFADWLRKPRQLEEFVGCPAE